MKRAICICLVAGLFPVVVSAQLEKSALDYVLQRPQVSKRFPQKRIADHLFLESGAGITFSDNSGSSGFSAGKPGGLLNVAVGDWLTPEHGVRLGVEGGFYDTGVRSKFVGFSADYLLNFTALCQKNSYRKARTFEFYGVAGVNLYSARNDGDNDLAWGAHLGLRGQAGISDYTYIYLEPRVGMYSDELFRRDVWRKYCPAASIVAGLGYRLQGGRNEEKKYKARGSFLDGTFVSFSGGPATLIGGSMESVKEHIGGRAAVSFGKWFDSYNGVRLNLDAVMHRQHGHPRNNALGAGMEYMLGLHNLFGGYDPDRRFWVDALAGAGVNISGSRRDASHLTFGLSAGLQANWALNDCLSLFAEPRLGIHQKRFAEKSATVGNWDVLPSAMLGLTFHNRPYASGDEGGDEKFVMSGWLDHVFFEGLFGFRKPVTGSVAVLSEKNLCAWASARIGKWFSPSSGIRLWGEAGRVYVIEEKTNAIAFGADYLWNVFNTFQGYKDNRRFEVDAALGFNLLRHSASLRLYPGCNASLQGVWNINGTWGLFVEPQARIYGNHLRAFASLSAGMRVNTAGSLVGRTTGFAEDEVRDDYFVSVAAGVYAHARNLKNTDMYGPAERVGFGRWVNPGSAWRVNVTNRTHKADAHRFVRTALGADYLMDISALTRGYDPERSVSLRAYGGTDLGVDHVERGKTIFAPDVHVGGEVVFRLSSSMEVYVEPQLSYQFKEVFGGSLFRFVPSVMVGINYAVPLKRKHLNNMSLQSF